MGGRQGANPSPLIHKRTPKRTIDMIEKNDTTSKTERLYNGYRFRGTALPTPPKKHIASHCNYEGRVFGRATTIELLGNEEHGYKWWGLVCSCGTKFAARSRELQRGHTRSCGCLQREVASINGTNTRLAHGDAAKHELFSSYLKSARDRNIEWNLSEDLFYSLVSGNCVYCGIGPNKLRKPHAQVFGGFMYTGIDRVNNRVGYTVANSVPCCWDCNRGKGTLSEEDFYSWIDRIYKYRLEHSFSGV